VRAQRRGSRPTKGDDDHIATRFHYPRPFTPEGTVRETGVQPYLPDSRTTTIAIDRSPGRTKDAPTLPRGPRRSARRCWTRCRPRSRSRTLPRCGRIHRFSASSRCVRVSLVGV